MVEHPARPDSAVLPQQTWVQVHQVLLPASQRAPNLPEDTKALPYEAWIKGFLTQPARIGEQATVRTLAGRLVTGRLVAVNPPYTHSFGRPVPAMLTIGPNLRAFLADEQR